MVLACNGDDSIKVQKAAAMVFCIESIFESETVDFFIEGFNFFITNNCKYVVVSF